MKLVLIGLPLYTRRIARLLSARGGRSSRFVSLDVTTPAGKARFLAEAPTADAVLTHWGTLRRSRALDLALRLGKHVVQCWAGSDVLDAARVSREGAAVSAYRDRCTHLCEAPWIKDELEQIGVRAEVAAIMPIDSVTPAAVVDEEMPFSVLSRVGAGSEHFYGLPHLIRLASDFPEVPVRVVGTSHAGCDVPANLDLVGWVDDMAPVYRSSGVFVRIPVHDGLSVAVREALAWGRHVVYRYRYPHCLQAGDYDSLRSHVKGLKDRFDAGALRPNVAGREFVLSEFADAKVFDELMSAVGKEA